MLEENTELQSCVSKTEDKLEQTVMELNSLRARYDIVFNIVW